MTIQNINSLRFLLVLGVGLLAHGCASEEAPSDDTADVDDVGAPDVATRSVGELALVAEANFEGGALRFYEVDGALLEQEIGDNDHARIALPNEDELTAEERYTALTGEPAPERLVALSANGVGVARADSDPVAAEDARIEKGGNIDFQGSGVLGFTDFYNRFCQPTDNYWERVAWPMTTRHTRGRARFYRFSIRADSGPIEYHFMYGPVGLGWATIEDGHYVSWRMDWSWPGQDMDSTARQKGEYGGVITHCVNSR